MTEGQTLESNIDQFRAHLRDDSPKETIKTAEQILHQLKKSGEDRPELVYEVRFWQSTSLWRDGQLKAAFHGFADVISLVEQSGDPLVKVPDQIAFCYMACADTGAKIAVDPELVLTIIDAGARFCRRYDKPDHRLMLEHIRSEILHGLDRVEQALSVAEQALASKRLNLNEEFGCNISCFTRVYVALLAASGLMDEAFQTVNHSLEEDPQQAALWSARANLHLLQGEFSLAAADMDKAVALQEETFYLLQRGLTKYLISGSTACASDLSKAFALDDSSAAKAAWCALLGQDKMPLTSLNKSDDKFTATLAMFIEASATEQQLLQSAEKQDDRKSALCLSHGFIALQAELNQNKTKARHHYQHCLATGRRDHQMYLWAQIRLPMQTSQPS